MKRLSIIVPVFNGVPFVENVLLQLSLRLPSWAEVLVSDDHSTDGSVNHKVIADFGGVFRFLRTPKEMSMSEHWDWALHHAQGDWVMFLGQDDAIQDFFFDKVLALLDTADERNLDAVAWRRAYYNWPSSNELLNPPGGVHVQYFCQPELAEKRIFWSGLKAAFFGGSYHFLPQMYTSSVFSRRLISEVRSRREDEMFFFGHPQDAMAAAIFFWTRQRFLWSGTPLTWVGTSSSSAGLAISHHQTEKRTNNRLATNYLTKVEQSLVPYPSWAGSFSIGDTQLYFFQALVQASHLADTWMSRLGRSLIVRKIGIFLVAASFDFNGSQSSVAAFREMLRRNGFGSKRLVLLRMLSTSQNVYRQIRMATLYWLAKISFFRRVMRVKGFVCNFGEIELSIHDACARVNREIGWSDAASGP